MKRNGAGPLAAVLLGLFAMQMACLPGWVTETSNTQEDLMAVWGFSASDVYAVGAKGTFLRRENGRWRALRSESEITATLFGVWGNAADHVLAVGEKCTILRYTGDLEPPEDGGTPPPPVEVLNARSCGDFRAIDGPDDAIIVGQDVAQRYSGGGVGNYSLCSGNLADIAYPAQNLAYAVGEAGRVCYYDSGWKEKTISLCAVELVNGECPNDPVSGQPLLITPVLFGAWVGPGGKGAVVGMYGGVWPLPFEDPWQPIRTGYDVAFRAVHGFEKASGEVEMIAVGDMGVAVRIQGTKASREVIDTPETLNGVWMSDDGKDAFVVGNKGLIAHMRK
jgi:hypothetical protein